MGKPHVVAIPYPAQGHVIPLLELVQRLAKQGFKVTFVNTDYDHQRVINTLSENDEVGDLINLVSIPDGLEPWEDRNDLANLVQSILRVMPEKLEDLLQVINGSEDDDVSCVIADESMGWALKVAEKMGIKRAAFWPASAAVLASTFSIPKLISDNIIGKDGTIIKKQMIQLSPNMPAMNTADFVWACIGDMDTQKVIFNVVKQAAEFVKVADYIICNSSDELEPGAFSLYPNILPIGPLLATNRLAKQAGHYWREDSTCLTWLNQQQPQSVIYVAFGSFTVFDKIQFQELAHALELTNRPFLWVVRPDMAMDRSHTDDAYPIGFKERVGTRGHMVGWAPQQNVLSHPSVACFLSHCGWNSTMEGVSNGLPFLCWPYFADQLLNESYICDVWKTGLGFEKDKRGIIMRNEIKEKVEMILGEIEYKERALELKEKAMNSLKEGGCSRENLSNFIEWMK